jgi:hypothetical protein
MDVVCIYCMIQRNMRLDVEWYHERYNSFKKAKKKRTLGVARTKKVNSFKETRRSWCHATDMRYVHICAKFERRLSIQFGRKKRNNFFLKGWLDLFHL